MPVYRNFHTKAVEEPKGARAKELADDPSWEEIDSASDEVEPEKPAAKK